VGDAYTNALAESIIELSRRSDPAQGAVRGLDQMEYATLEWVHWFNTSRLLEPIGYIPPEECEKVYYTRMQRLAVGADSNNPAPVNPGRFSF
jgi:transposase InsO family protein